MLKLFTNEELNINVIEIDLLKFLYSLTLNIENDDFGIIAESVYANEMCRKLIILTDHCEDGKDEWAAMNLANLTWFNEEFYDKLFQGTELVDRLSKMLASKKELFLLDILTTVTNLIATNNSYRDKIFQDTELLMNLLFIIYNEDSEKLLECALKTVYNIIRMVECDAVVTFCFKNVEMLDLVLDKINTKRSIIVMLRISQIVNQLFTIGDTYINKNPEYEDNVFIARVENDERLFEQLIEAKNHKDSSVYLNFTHILINYFDYQD